MPISITIVGAREVAAKFAAMPAKLHQELLKTISQLSLDLQADVVQDKLHGKVLNHITGRLAGSIHSDQPPKQTADSIIGRVYSAGCNYAAIHEFGGTIKHPGGTSYTWGEGDNDFNIRFISNADAAISKHVLGVTKAHDINMPERSFLRSSLKDFEPRIISDIQAAVARGTA